MVIEVLFKLKSEETERKWEEKEFREVFIQALVTNTLQCSVSITAFKTL